MHIVCRKLVAAYFSASIIGLFFGFLFTMDFDTERAVNFYGMTLIALFYGGIVILLYGTSSSLISEYINKRWLRDQTLPFVIIHIIFGAIFGTFFNEFVVILLGILGALFYSLTDRVLYKQKEESKIAFLFLLSPPAVFLSGIVFFWITGS